MGTYIYHETSSGEPHLKKPTLTLARVGWLASKNGITLWAETIEDMKLPPAANYNRNIKDTNSLINGNIWGSFQAMIKNKIRI